MRTLQRRIRRIEEQLGSKLMPGFLVVLGAAAGRLAVEEDTCLQILRECGSLRDAGGFWVVRLNDIPEGLDAKQTKRFLRKRGAEICTPHYDC